LLPGPLVYTAGSRDLGSDNTRHARVQQLYGSLWKTKKVTELDLSVVVPVFNEAAGISQFLSPLRVTLDSMQLNYEVIVVDDGSVDQTVEEVFSSRWPEVRLVF